MENHHFSWENSLEMVIFNSKLLVYQRVMFGIGLQIFGISTHHSQESISLIGCRSLSGERTGGAISLPWSGGMGLVIPPSLGSPTIMASWGDMTKVSLPESEPTGRRFQNPKYDEKT